MVANVVTLSYNVEKVEQHAKSSLRTDNGDTLLDMGMIDDEMSSPTAGATANLNGHTIDKMQASVEELVASESTQPFSPAGESRVVQECHDDSLLECCSCNSDDEQQRFLHQHSDHSIRDGKDHSKDKMQEQGLWKGNCSKDVNNLDHEGKWATSHSLSHHSKDTHNHYRDRERRQDYIYPRDNYYQSSKDRKEKQDYSFPHDYYYSKETEWRNRWLQYLYYYPSYMYYYPQWMNNNSQTYRHHTSVPSTLYNNQTPTSHSSSFYKKHNHNTTTRYSSGNNDMNGVRKAKPQPQCLTPHFERHHTTVHFTPMGQLILVPGKGDQAIVQVCDVKKIMEKNPTEAKVIHHMKHFPGPLTL